MCSSDASKPVNGYGMFRSQSMNTLEKLLELSLSGSRRTDDGFSRESLVSDISVASIVRSYGGGGCR